MDHIAYSRTPEGQTRRRRRGSVLAEFFTPEGADQHEGLLAEGGSQ